MRINVGFARDFLKKLERLGRKFPRVVDQVDDLMSQLKEAKHPGDKIPGVGYDVYKVRLKNPSAGKGKRGGFRVIYYIRLADHIVLLTIYSKSDQTDISADQIQKLIADYIPSDAAENGDTE